MTTGSVANKARPESNLPGASTPAVASATASRSDKASERLYAASRRSWRGELVPSGTTVSTTVRAWRTPLLRRLGDAPSAFSWPFLARLLNAINFPRVGRLPYRRMLLLCCHLSLRRHTRPAASLPGGSNVNAHSKTGTPKCATPVHTSLAACPAKDEKEAAR